MVTLLNGRPAKPAPAMDVLHGPDGVTAEFALVTPEVAESWLRHNQRNRNLREQKVTQYAIDLEEGRWKLNGATVCFNVDNLLDDGQHRLHAIIKSGKSMWCLVVRGLPTESQDTMDIGAIRQVGDQLKLRGEKNGKNLGAVVRNATRLAEGKTSFSGNGDLTNPKVLAEFAKDPEGYRIAGDAGRRVASRNPVAAGIIGGAYYVCALLSEEDAHTFFCEQLADGVGLQIGDPAHTLIAKFRKAEINGHRMHPDDQIRFTLLAWNIFREQRRVTKLQAPKGGWTPKNFPMPV